MTLLQGQSSQPFLSHLHTVLLHTSVDWQTSSRHHWGMYSLQMLSRTMLRHRLHALR